MLWLSLLSAPLAHHHRTAAPYSQCFAFPMSYHRKLDAASCSESDSLLHTAGSPQKYQAAHAGRCIPNTYKAPNFHAHSRRFCQSENGTTAWSTPSSTPIVLPGIDCVCRHPQFLQLLKEPGPRILRFVDISLTSFQVWSSNWHSLKLGADPKVLGAS